jgi:hypothetical protein
MIPRPHLHDRLSALTPPPSLTAPRYYTGHNTGRLTGERPMTALRRPGTAPALSGAPPPTSTISMAMKRSWDTSRFSLSSQKLGGSLPAQMGKQSATFRSFESGRYSLSRMGRDRARGIRHSSYRDNPKTHSMIK